MDDLTSEFISETSDALAVLDRELAARPEQARRHMAQLVHSIKSTSGFLGLQRLEALAGSVEKTLRRAAETTPPVLAALERIKALVEALATDGEEPQGDDRELIRALGETVTGAETSSTPIPATERKVPAEPAHKPVSLVFATSHHALPAVQPRAVDIAIEAVTPKNLPAVTAPRRTYAAEDITLTSSLVETRNRLQHLARLGAKDLDAPIKQLTHTINQLQQRLDPTFIDGIAISRVVVLEAMGQNFALPQADVQELVRIGDGSPYRAERVGDAWLVRLRDRLLPLMPLAEILQLAPQRATMTGYAAILRVGGMDFGVLVDAVHDMEELVVRPMSTLIGTRGIYRGASLRGDGSIVLTLDALGIGTRFGAQGGAYRASHTAEEDSMEYLIFNAGAPSLMAVPLAHVVQLKSFRAREIKGNRALFQDAPLPLVTLPSLPLTPHAPVNTIVLNHRERLLGIVIEQAIETAKGPALTKRVAQEPYCLGSVMLAGRTVDILDLDYLQRQEEQA